jgi:hypothetical protein
MFLKELHKSTDWTVVKSLVRLLEAEQSAMVGQLKTAILDALLSYQATAEGSPNVPFDKFLKSITVPGIDLKANQALIIEIIESLTEVVKEVDVRGNKIVLKSALNVRDKKSNPEKNKEKVSKMANRAIKKRQK